MTNPIMNTVDLSKRSLPHLLGAIPAYHRLYQYYSEKNFRKHYRDVLRSQWFSIEDMGVYQSEHLQQIIRHAYHNVPYYKNLFDKFKISVDEIKSPSDLLKIPILEKDQVKQYYGHFKALGCERFRPSAHKTSGSTGMPLKVLIDQNVDSIGSALIWRHYNWAGRKFHSRAAYITMPFGFGSGRIDSENLFVINSTKRTLKINSALINGETLDQICRLLEEFRPSHIESYPSLMNVFAKFLMESPDHDIRPHSITLRAEKLYPGQRELLEDVFQCPCFEFYGMWEYLVFAAECEYHCLHLDFELGIVEIVKNGRLCPIGEIGEIVATGIHNYSMPLIRYATGDYGYIRNEVCQCGREMPIIEIVGGREKDLIVTRKGFFNVMSGLPLMLGKDNIIKQIQFYQENKDTLIVRLVKGEEFSDSDREGVKAAISNYLLNSIDITLEFLEYIPRTAAGKYKYVISKVPIEV